jgi:putative ABC transport system ATP-binding protein
LGKAYTYLRRQMDPDLPDARCAAPSLAERGSSSEGAPVKRTPPPPPIRAEQKSPSSVLPHDPDDTKGGFEEDDDVFPEGDLEAQEDLIVAENIHKTYLLGVEGVPALRGVSLRIKRGEFIVILGKSGGGKTSLLNILGTIDKPTKGELKICGTKITASTADQAFASLRLNRIGFVFQTFNLVSTMTALENVCLPMTLKGTMTRGAIIARAKELLGRVGMASRIEHLPSQLSGGEQQRVTIARSVANSPAVLLLDEPTGDLDTKNTHTVLKLLMDLNRKEKITCIMVTHDTGLKSYAHRVVHMLDGKIHRIEENEKAKRDAADAELEELINQDGVDKKALLDTKILLHESRDPTQFYPWLSFK